MKKKDCIPYVFHIQSFSIYLLIALFHFRNFVKDGF